MRIRSFPLTVFLFCLPFAAHAQNASDELLRLLYVKSGLQTQLQQLPFTVQEMFDQRVASGQYGTLDAKIISALRKGIRTPFVPDTMKETIIEELRKRLSSEDVREVLVWLESPLGTKITKLEEAASTPDTMKELPQFAEKLREAPPAQDRLRVLERLDAATRATETNVEVIMIGQLSVIVALVATLPEEKRAPIADIRAEVEKTRPQFESMVKTHVLVIFLYTYRSLTVSELDIYVKFAESDVGRRYHNAAVAGLKKVLNNFMMQLGSAIANVLEAHKK